VKTSIAETADASDTTLVTEKAIAAALAEKQGNLSAGDGISISDAKVSAKLGSGLVFDNSKQIAVDVDNTTLEVDGTSGKVQIKEYQVRQEDSRFDQVMASNDPEMLEMFLQYYPDSPRRAEVEAKLRSLGEYDKFRAIQAQNTFKAYLTYLNDNPNGAFRDEAEAGIFELVKSGNRLKDYEIYLKRFPNGKYVEEAKAALQRANNENSMIEYQTGTTYSEPAQQAEEPAVEESDDEEEVEEAKPAKNKKASKKANKKAKKSGKKAKSKKKK
jgi:hypothetical protein